MEELNKITRLLRERVRDTYSAIELEVMEDHPSKEQELLNGIIKGKFKTDDDAAKKLYGSTGEDQRFRMLKSRLRQRLLNLLYFVDYRDSKTKISTQYEQESSNYIHRAKILLREGLDDIAEKLINKGLSISRETELTEVTLEGLRMLRGLLSFHCKPAKFFRVISDIEKYNALQAVEEEAFNLYFKHRMLVRKSVNSRKKNLGEAMVAAKELESLWIKTKSFNIFEKYYFLNVICHESVGDFSSILDLTEKTERMVKDGEINPLRFDERYNVFMRTYAFLRTHQYADGLKYADYALAYFERSSSNWFAHMENYYLLAIRCQEYDLAAQIIDQVFRNPNMDKLASKPTQRWQLLRAYLYHIHPTKQLNDIVNFDQFYLSLNVLSQDKQGFNVALMVLEFLHYLRRGEREKLLDKVERLEKYIYRHLNDGDVTQRDKLFFKLLLTVIDCDFDADQARGKGEKILSKLKQSSEPGDAYADLEVIPYEDLWNHVIGVEIKNKVVA